MKASLARRRVKGLNERAVLLGEPKSVSSVSSVYLLVGIPCTCFRRFSFRERESARALGESRRITMDIGEARCSPPPILHNGLGAPRACLCDGMGFIASRCLLLPVRASPVSFGCSSKVN